jgi:hypothetical protein
MLSVTAGASVEARDNCLLTADFVAAILHHDACDPHHGFARIYRDQHDNLPAYSCKTR